MKSTHNIFHFHDDEQVVDIDASSLSEARRLFRQSRGYFPPDDDRNEVEPVR